MQKKMVKLSCRFFVIKVFGILLISSILLIATIGCYVPKESSTQSAYPHIAGSEEKSIFLQAKRYYKDGRYYRADELLERLIVSYPYMQLTDDALLYRGHIAFKRRQYALAESYYKKSISRVKSSTIVPHARFRLAGIYYKYHNYQKSYDELLIARTLSNQLDISIPMHSLGYHLTTKLPHVSDEQVIWAFYLMNDYANGQGYFSKHDDYDHLIVSELEVKSICHTWVETGVIDIKKWKVLYEQEFDKGPANADIAYKLAKEFIRTGNHEAAKFYLTALIQSHPKYVYFSKVQQMLGDIGFEAGMLSNIRIGVILPLTGKYAVYGQSVLNGLQCALGIFSPCQGPGGIELVIKDSKSGYADVAGLVGELENDNVIGIIGPLLSRVAFTAGQRSQELSLPMITFAQKPGIEKIGNYIFRNSITPYSEVDTLLHYVFDQTSLKRFMILYPNNRKGLQYRNLFNDQVTKMGGTIVDMYSYPSDQMEFSKQLRATKKSKAPYIKKIVSARHYYDAIFIPDSHQMINYIVPTLAVAGVRRTTYLGISRWNDEGLAKSIGSHLRRSLFVAALNNNHASATSRAFFSQFESAYVLKPTLLEALAYDDMNMIIHMLEHGFGKKRDDLQRYLLTMSAFNGVVGSTTFDGYGDSQHKLSVMTVKNNAIVPVN